MPAISRITDLWTGICCCHSDPTCISMGGYIITSSSRHISSALGVARVGDMTVGYCGHTGTIVTGSSRNVTEGQGKALVGSQVSGCNIGTIITGDPRHVSL